MTVDMHRFAFHVAGPSSQEALSMHFSFKLVVTITLLSSTGSLALCTRTYVPSRILYYSNSVWEQDHIKVKRVIMSQLWLRMVRCYRKFDRSEILSRRSYFLGNFIAERYFFLGNIIAARKFDRSRCHGS